MEFLFRDKEINELRRLRWLSEEQYSRTMVLTGVTGVGKTALIRQALSGYKVLFLFVSHKSEGLMLGDFKREIFSKLGLEIAPYVQSLSDIFSLLFDASERETFTVVVDQFHLLPQKVLSHVSSLISEKKRKTGINLIFVSSDEISSNLLFQNEGSVLFNCIDSALSLKPFSHDELKQILGQSKVPFSPENLFTLYAISGGIPRYVEALISSQDFISEVYRNGSIFMSEGTAILNSIFGNNSEVYFSILEVISRGARSQSEIESALGGFFNVGGHLAKLESVYGLIKKSRPIFSSNGARGVVRYSITNPFLEFWFKYVEFYRPLLEMGDFGFVASEVRRRLMTENQSVLERYFREKLYQENHSYEIGSWWAPSTKSNEDLFELPIVAYSKKNNKTVIAEVCYTAADFDKERYLKAVKRFKLSNAIQFGVDTRLFVLEDI